MKPHPTIRIAPDNIHIRRQLQRAQLQPALLGNLAPRAVLGGLPQLLRPAGQAPAALVRRLATPGQQHGEAGDEELDEDHDQEDPEHATVPGRGRQRPEGVAVVAPTKPRQPP